MDMAAGGLPVKGWHAVFVVCTGCQYAGTAFQCHFLVVLTVVTQPKIAIVRAGGNRRHARKFQEGDMQPQIRHAHQDRLRYVQAMLGELRTMAEAERCDLLTFMIESPDLVDEYLMWTIAEGGAEFGSSMPAYRAFLTQREIWKIVAYMRAGFPGSESP